MRRSAPGVLVTVGLLALLASYVWYTRRIAAELNAQGAATSRMYARVYEGLTDTTGEGGLGALADLSRSVRELGVPVVLTDPSGAPYAAANTPFDALVRDPAHARDPRLLDYVRALDRENAPVVRPGLVTVHFGRTPFLNRMRVVPFVQLAALVVLVFAGVSVLRARSRAEREHVWAGMARESAHQLGTPLSSLSGWLELLRAREGDPVVAQALPHMQGDIERLERVSHRFERIGRPPRRDPVDVSAVAANVVAYFAARAPTLAHPIAVRAERPADAIAVPGDLVLLEWAVESLVKNALDALAGRGGAIVVRVDPRPEGGARVRVSDDGPGIPRDLRSRIFSPGFTTKESGWGLGLALTRRIVEENHGGRLTLVPSDRGAVFDIILPG
ncbi:MAG TPA: HAMP domain-containing sensor histidine kinase [Gemmatimonadaceae bacterium]|nr:HAMP domain-containing sensor histidine kinase [Gemmatimonadaceae bacterium]